MKTIIEPEKLALGTSLPPGDRHGVSVHLPKWNDTVGWASREPRVLEAMTTGYPRFFIPRVVLELAMRLLEGQRSRKDALSAKEPENKLAVILSSIRHAQLCRKALLEWSAQREGHPPCSSADIGVYVVTWEGSITAVNEGLTSNGPDHLPPRRSVQVGEEDIILVSYPFELVMEAKSFWQHTGFGISSRRATHWLEHAPFLGPQVPETGLPSPAERRDSIAQARAALKERIAAGHSSNTLTVSPSDVFLFPTGMTAMAEVASAIKALRTPTPGTPYRVAVFGFLYVDTFKVLQRVLGYEPTLYKYTTADLDALEAALSTSSTPAPSPFNTTTTTTTTTNTTSPPTPRTAPPPTNPNTTPKFKFNAIITEFPGNPLLQSPDLARLHRLAQHHGAVLVVDDTVGTHASVALLTHCDVAVTSLTKMFSGGCNVMGGSVVLSPGSGVYEVLREGLLGNMNVRNGGDGKGGEGDERGQGNGDRDGDGGDKGGEGDGGDEGEGKQGDWFWEDVLVMEENSRNFNARVWRASDNAEVVVGWLRASPVVREVFYPLGSPTQDVYDRYRVEGGKYGFLLSIRFATPTAAVAFYDALDVAKGPSLGTNFTLCCAYTLLAHYRELEWAAEYGVVEDLVRISVGLEERDWLEQRVRGALRAAEGVLGD
ncbi:PLP-dependent transferase [Parathielavia hyrcaniae]|uniref:PLP-dependent transferase n=1 Tax=Parathielavia hyrcaniae TaxID=113614 RepID=A0AAN6PYN9_9PEZI|nr:PLP-dependent transferase [Parathielavia hyrcaniae]